MVVDRIWLAGIDVNSLWNYANTADMRLGLAKLWDVALDASRCLDASRHPKYPLLYDVTPSILRSMVLASVLKRAPVLPCAAVLRAACLLFSDGTEWDTDRLITLIASDDVIGRWQSVTLDQDDTDDADLADLPGAELAAIGRVAPQQLKLILATLVLCRLHYIEFSLQAIYFQPNSVLQSEGNFCSFKGKPVLDTTLDLTLARVLDVWTGSLANSAQLDKIREEVLQDISAGREEFAPNYTRATRDAITSGQLLGYLLDVLETNDKPWKRVLEAVLRGAPPAVVILLALLMFKQIDMRTRLPVPSNRYKTAANCAILIQRHCSGYFEKCVRATINSIKATSARVKSDPESTTLELDRFAAYTSCVGNQNQEDILKSLTLEDPIDVMMYEFRTSGMRNIGQPRSLDELIDPNGDWAAAADVFEISVFEYAVPVRGVFEDAAPSAPRARWLLATVKRAYPIDVVDNGGSIVLLKPEQQRQRAASLVRFLRVARPGADNVLHLTKVLQQIEKAPLSHLMAIFPLGVVPSEHCVVVE